MKVQHITSVCENERLLVNWDLFYDTEVLFVQVSTDLDFLNNVRMFCLPQSTSCSLTVGPGSWFVRVGVLMKEVVEWSGVYGPTDVYASSFPSPVPQSAITITNNQSIQNGIRIYTGQLLPYYAFVEYSEEPQFLANQTKIRLLHDIGNGYIDCLGLLYPTTYYLRLRSFVDKPNELPTTSIKLLGTGTLLLGKKAAKPIQHSNNIERTSSKADEHLVREVKENKNYRFSSYSDYVRHKAALEKMRE